ncbi:MAG: NAD(P)-dependent oxidoreductase [Crocinitomicaceae bacterium]
MKKITLGILREGKVPPDKRVPLTPLQCKKVEAIYPQVKVIVQPSPVRSYKDQEYLDAGISMSEDLSACDIIMGVKEVNVEDLLPNKKFMFFSHTFKKQPYNRGLLKTILEKKIQLIDYEILKNTSNKRVIGFGRYAGIVGAYNGFLAYGKKHGYYDLKQANLCANRIEVEEELKKVELPSNTKIVLTGYGRVGHGAREILDLLPITEVSPSEFLKEKFDSPVYTQLELEDYYEAKKGGEFDKKEFYSAPENYRSSFGKYVAEADMYMPCHYWSNKADVIITNEDLKKENRRLSVIADISCDIAGPIASTIRPSTIASPIYGYDPVTESEVDFMHENAIAVMAVDNLPCELPLDASEDFGSELIKEVFDALFLEDPTNMIERASETDLNGQLMPNYSYLEEYLAEK